MCIENEVEITSCTIFVLGKRDGTGLHKGVFVVPEYFNYTLGTNSTYRGHASLTTLNQMELWFCVYYVLNVGGVFIYQPYRR